MKSPHQIWATLSTRARKHCLEDIANSWTDPAFLAAAAKAISQAVSFRPTTVRRAEPQHRARIVANAIPKLAPSFLLHLLVVMHHERRSEMLSSVYDALGVSHEGVDLDPEALEVALDADEVTPPLSELAAKWPLEDLWLCMAVMEHRRPEGWSVAVTAAQEHLRNTLDAEVAQVAGVSPSEHPKTEDDGLFAPEAPQFTTLDRAVIKSIARTLNSVEGSFDWDELDDLVQEILELSVERAQSRFHRGFLDAILSRELPRRDPGDNTERRAWYLVGFMLGLLRRDPDHDVLEELASLLNSDRKALLNRNCVAGAMLAKQMLPSLLEKRAYNDAIRWIEAHGANCATSIATIVLGWTAHALQQVQDPSSLRRVLRSTIDHAAPNLSEQEGSLARLLERRLAIALRLEGRLDHAEKVIEQLLESCGDDDERAHLLDQRILIHLGVRSLETLELPEDDAPRKQLLDSITRRRLEIVEAISGGSPSPIALVALALPAVADRSPQEEARAEAVGWLRRALDPMRGGGEVWERSGLLARVRFYLSVLELRSGKADDAASAAGRLVALLEEEARLPGEFFLDQVEDIAIHDVRQVNELARLALVRYGHRALKKLDLETLSRRSVEFRRALSETLDGPGREFKNAERWPAWEQLLRGALEATPRDLESAEQALGALEALSTGPDLSERFVELLEVTPPLWDPVWESTERDEARFRIYRDLGRLEQARAVLVPLAHAAITEGRLGYASELLEMLGDLPVDQAAREGLSVRLAAAQTLTPPPLSRAATPPVSVFFIGGNETQAAYERQLRQAIHEKHPSTSLEFKFPGWGANWGRVLQHTETQIARSDVVVVMRFMRTHLGRAVRRLASKHEKPWVPCTGHGYASLERAIIEAVHLAAR